MSSREHLITLARDALKATLLPAGDAYNYRACAEAVLDALLPLITEPKQLMGVPEGSLLIYFYAGSVRALWWMEDALWSVLHVSYPPDFILSRYGALTVVAMP